MTLSEERLEAILRAAAGARVGVVGDFCLDAYWYVDDAIRERSVETDLPVRAVVDHRYSLGGGANAAANVAALGPKTLHVFAVVGNDPFGREVRRQLEAIGADVSGLIVQDIDWITPVYAKPHAAGVEENRFDFGLANAIAPEAEARLLEAVERALTDLDVLIVNSQLRAGYLTKRVVDRLSELADKHRNKVFLLDARFDAAGAAGMLLKLNDLEAAKFCDERDDSASFVSGAEGLTEADSERHGRAIAARTGRPVCVTRGARGMILVEGDGAFHIPGIEAPREIDTVGAGDTVAAALAVALAARASLDEAGWFANLAASVTIRKLRQTGTASPDEIRTAARDAEYVYQADLADAPERARRAEGSHIEIVTPRDAARIRHAVFDHDGTISILREGWQAVMEPMMVRAILGCAPEEAPDDAERVGTMARDYIDRSTGIQTILQMQALEKMVRDFGRVPESDVLSAAEYKAIYNEALMRNVDARTKRLETGDARPGDFILAGAVEFLTALRERGARLYLASGTDEEDVRREAELLGYADLFNGGIFGSVGDVSKYSKKMVIERIIRENGLSGSELATFGDGPVELRETRKHDGVCVGIASDELHPGLLDLDKRRRLIRAGGACDRARLRRARPPARPLVRVRRNPWNTKDAFPRSTRRRFGLTRSARDATSASSPTLWIARRWPARRSRSRARRSTPSVAPSPRPRKRVAR